MDSEGLDRTPSHVNRLAGAIEALAKSVDAKGGLVVLLVVPSHALADLLEPNVAQADEHGADLAAVSILLVAARLYPLLEHERR